MNRETIQRIISEEIVRPEVSSVLKKEKTSFSKQIGGMLKHPMALTILGFFLTSLVGSYISQMIADRSQRDTELQGALAAIGEFASEASELRVQQSYLVDAMERGESKLVLERVKAEYDESYLSWNASRYRNYLTLRSFFGFTYDNFAEQLVSRTIHQDFRAYNSCLSRTYVNYVGSDQEVDAREEMNACLEANDRPGATGQNGFVDPVAMTNERIFQCSRRIFDTTHHFIALDLHCGKNIWKPDTGALAGIYDSIWDECGREDKRPLNQHKANFDAFCTMQDSDKSWFK